MKILQVSNFFAKVHGGSAEVPYQISKTLAEHGHQVTVFTSDLGMACNSSSPPGVAVRAFRTWLQLAGFNVTFGISKAAKQIVKDFDLIHMHNYRTFQNVIVYRYAKKYRVPYIVQAHGSIGTYFQKGIFKKIFDIIIGYRMLRGAAKVFAVTEFEAQQYVKIGVSREKIVQVPHGIDLEEYGSPLETGVFRKKFGLTGKDKIILYLGRLNRIKGLDILAAAFAGLVEKRQNVKLVVTGPDDGYLPAIKKKITDLNLGDCVIFTGALYGREKLQAYTDADVYVLPSSYEIFGITILEAWACGKPVIVTDRCGLADDVKDKGGIVVQYSAPPLRNALAKLLDDTELGRRYGRQGRQMVEERFNWQKIAGQVEKTYQEIVAERQAGRDT
jgi:glycosyltransferase involved in cell wall biosynthesis